MKLLNFLIRLGLVKSIGGFYPDYKPCDHCNGSGKIEEYDKKKKKMVKKTCFMCNGFGKVAPTSLQDRD